MNGAGCDPGVFSISLHRLTSGKAQEVENSPYTWIGPIAGTKHLQRFEIAVADHYKPDRRYLPR